MAGNRYDRAVTVFSPDGHLFQVEYAQEAVKRGSTAVGVVGKNIVVVGVEKKAIPKLQVERTIRKIASLDDHVVMAFAGLTADARILIDKLRIECQSHRLTVEDPVNLEYITRYLATIMQKYTQGRGRRPFGLSIMLTGFDDDGTPHLYLTDPAGAYHEWKACAIGRNDKTVKEYLEKQYSDELAQDDERVVRLAVCALLEVVQASGKSIDIAVMKRGSGKLEMLSEQQLTALVEQIEKEKEEEARLKQEQQPPRSS